MRCLENIFGYNNKQGIVLCTFTRTEPVQFIVVGHGERTMRTVVIHAMKTTHKWEAVTMLCLHFHQQNYDVQCERCLSGVMRVCEPMQTISKVMFNYGKQEPNIDAVR